MKTSEPRRLTIEAQRLASKRTRIILKSNDFLPVESWVEVTFHPGGSTHIRVINGTSSYMWFSTDARHGWRLASHLVRWHVWTASNEGRAYVLAKRGLLKRPQQRNPIDESDIPF